MKIKEKIGLIGVGNMGTAILEGLLEKHLVDMKAASEADIEGVKKKVEGLISKDLAWAENQPPPKPDDALGGVYAETGERSAVGKS